MMKPIPLVNRQALGNAMTVSGIQTPKQGTGQRTGPRTKLGQMGPMIGGEELVYRAAVDNLEGVKRAYSKLITLLGEGEAGDILKEAREAVEKAQAAYGRQIPQK